MEKRVSQAFDKVVYLLGKDKEGTYYWLEEPHWDCGWYWGFGYIESYTNNTDPKFSRDVASHEHAEDFYPKWFGADNSILTETTFSESEGWELVELFERFYLLRNMAKYFYKGKCRIAITTIENWAMPKLTLEINKTRIPIIMDRITQILTPNKEK